MLAISEVERFKIEKMLADAQFCTLMSDGSTDVSVIENEVVYVHFVYQGKPHCYFLGMIECESANSNGIYSAIMQALKFKALPKETILQKVVAFAGDGASVNTGHLNGVIAHFRRRIDPSIIMVKCMSHRVELAYKSALQTAPLYSKTITLLDQLFKFYHKSALQTKILKNTFSALSVTQSLPTRIGDTRWIGHIETALKSLRTGYKAFVTHLSQVAIQTGGSSATQPKAKALMKLLKAKDVMTFVHFLSDVVAVLAKFSKCLQKRETCLYEIHQELDSTISNIEKLKERPGSELRYFIACDEYEGETLTGNANNCPQQQLKALTALVESMKDRFSDMDAGVMKSAKIADLPSWPATQEEANDIKLHTCQFQLQISKTQLEFGDDYVATLVEHYRSTLIRQDVDVCSIGAEWTKLKQLLYDNHKVHELSWSTVNDLYDKSCHNILQVIDLVLSLPAGSSECERGFSQMKLIKNSGEINLEVQQ